MRFANDQERDDFVAACWRIQNVAGRLPATREDADSMSRGYVGLAVSDIRNMLTVIVAVLDEQDARAGKGGG